MFSRWGAFVYRFRKPIALVAIVVAILASTVAGKAASVLSAGGWLDPTSESTTVNDRLASEFGAGHGTLIAVFHGPSGTNAASPDFQGKPSAADLHVTPDGKFLYASERTSSSWLSIMSRLRFSYTIVSLRAPRQS